MIEKITNTILWIKWRLKFNLKINPREKVKLNLGCGLAVHPEWYNIDGSFNALLANFPALILKLAYNFTGSRHYHSIDEFIKILKNNNFYQYNLKYGIPLRSNSVDYIFSCHFIEHLSKSDANFLMSECYRVLKKGGIVRTVIPDLDYALRIMNNGHFEKALNNYFFVGEGEKVDFSRHKYMYNFKLFEKLLIDEKFTDITKCSFQNGKVPNIETLDNRPEESLYIEATK